MLHVDPVTRRSEGRAGLIEGEGCCPPSRFGLRPMSHDDGGIQAAFLRDSASTSTPMMSLSFMIRYSTSSILTSVPDHLPNSTRSPALTSIGKRKRLARQGTGM